MTLRSPLMGRHPVANKQWNILYDLFFLNMVLLVDMINNSVLNVTIILLTYPADDPH